MIDMADSGEIVLPALGKIASANVMRRARRFGKTNRRIRHW
jgi:hypothetical protein